MNHLRINRKQRRSEHRLSAEIVADHTTGSKERENVYCNKMNTNTANIWNESRYCEKVSKSCSTTGNRRVTLVTNPVTFHERRKDQIVTTTDPNNSYRFTKSWWRHENVRRDYFNLTTRNTRRNCINIVNQKLLD
jgi:hypothetical protein